MLRARNIPFWDLDKAFDDMNRMFAALHGPLGLRSAPSGTFPPVNIYDGEDAFLITAEIPGAKADEIDLTVVENNLTIKGSRNNDDIGEKDRIYRRERKLGDFQRTVTLGEKVDPQGVKANYKNGVLHITLPKVEKAKPRSIKVQTS